MNYELVNFCELDKYAEEAYCAVHDVNPRLNLGDITKVNEKEIADFNMIVGGSPCQDFSVAGKKNGVEWTCQDCLKENCEPYSYNPLTAHYTQRGTCPNCNSTNIDKTRSSLLVEWLRILREKKPDFGIYENVKNIVGKQFKATFDLFENELKEYGYNTYWKVLNAKDYGIPQNRERIYLILIKKELDNGKFEFPKPFDNGLRLKDILEDDVDETLYISQDKVEKMLSSGFTQEKSRIQNSDICDCLLARDYKDPKCVPIDKSYNNPKPIEVANCITAREDRGISNRVKEGTAVLENKVKQVGNYIEGAKWNNPQVGRVYDTDGCSPTLSTMQGGDRQPKILQTPRGFNAGGLHDDATTISSHTWESNNFVVEHTAKEDNSPCEPKVLCPQREYSEDGIRSVKHSISDIVPTVLATQYKAGDNQPKIIEPMLRKDNIANAALTVGNKNCVFENFRIRKLSPKECWRLMGFSDEDFNKAKYQSKEYSEELLRKYPNHKGKRIMEHGERIQRISNSQMYKIAGNSIVTNVLFHIYIELHKAMPYLFEDIKLSSFFSGCGAFEKALDNFYKYIQDESCDVANITA